MLPGEGRIGDEEPRMNICIVGYGMTGQSHARIFKQEGHRLHTAVGRLPDRTEAFARQWGFQRHTTDLQAALADPEIEAVVLCTPSEQHAAQTELALRAGKHVLCEIPLAMSFEEGRRLAQLARRQGRVLMVAHTHRYYPAMRRAHEIIAGGAVELHNIIARYVFLRRENVGASGYRRSWTDNLLWHHGCHAVDMVLWMFGITEPGQVEVTAHVALPDQKMGIPMDLSVLIRTPRDQLASVNMSYNSHLSLYDYLLIGREDTFLITENRLHHRHGILYDPAVHTTEERNGALLQDREFVNAIREQRPPAISAESVLPALEVLQRVQDAYDARRPAGAMHPIAP
jgi:2-hydroxy-4-carboxymuconate semialdehyde hemiacetal dehydrogenase